MFCSIVHSLRIRSLLLTLCACFFFGAASLHAQAKAGAVYVMTNQVANSVDVFDRASDGSLTSAGSFLTGGAGLPTGNPFGNPNDPLASQGSVILGRNNQLLFVVNAGSNEISVFTVQQNGLSLVDKVSSGGQMPLSLTIHNNLLYALNSGAVPNITGFVIGADGKLSPLPGSTRPLSGDSASAPAEVAFTPNGNVLVVTEKNTNLIDTYTVDGNGLPSGPAPHPSSGIEPFGFSFAHHDILVDSETMQAAPQQGAASSYRVSDSGDLELVSASVHDFQTAPCWLVVTENSRFAYTTNTATGSISSYSIGAEGTLTLLNSTAASTGGPTSFPIDIALSNGGRFLYALLNGSHGIVGYRIEADGSLVQVASVTGLPPASQGIAAK